MTLATCPFWEFVGDPVHMLCIFIIICIALARFAPHDP